jgi:hypothetical protein
MNFVLGCHQGYLARTTKLEEFICEQHVKRVFDTQKTILEDKVAKAITRRKTSIFY